MIKSVLSRISIGAFDRRLLPRDTKCGLNGFSVATAFSISMLARA